MVSQSSLQSRWIGLMFAIGACLVLVFGEATEAASKVSIYNIGIGKSDITGPVAEVVLMGFAEPTESAAGLLNRLYARAFITEDPTTKERVVIVNCDLGTLFQMVHQEVLARLSTKFGSLYTAQNVLLHAIHTHAGPGGSSAYFVYDVTILGYIHHTFDAIVAGIVDAISQAHASLRPGTIVFSKGKILDASKNRSPAAYLRNPAQERAQYPSGDFDVDLRMLQFRDASDKSLRGVLGWFPVHATSLTNKNLLVSGDNKGYAEWMVEQKYPGVIVGIGMSNGADVSPNRIDNGDGTFSGEGRDPIESAEIIGARQANEVLELLSTAATTATPITGSIISRLKFVDFSNVTIHDRSPTIADAYNALTCPAVLGQNFGAGTEDGRGLNGLTEGNLKGNAFYLAFGETLQQAPQWVQSCQQQVKIPLIAAGLAKPIPWVPEVLPVQVVKIGQLGLAVTNFETTTMSGRRIRAAVQNALAPAGVVEVEIVACSNAYAQYMATREEYFEQDYEGASTLFGPNQQAAVQQELVRVARSVANASIPLDIGPSPRTFDRSKLFTLQTDVIMDSVPLGVHFGNVRKQPLTNYSIGATASVSFYGAHPKNNLQQIASFCDLEKQNNPTWTTFLRDEHWDVRFRWQRVGIAESQSTCEWFVRADAPTSLAGTYRFRHRGFSKNLMGTLTAYEGISNAFQVVV